MKKHKLFSMVLLCVCLGSCREDDAFFPELKEAEATDSKRSNVTDSSEFITLSEKTDPSVVEFMKKYRSNSEFKRRITSERSTQAISSAIERSRHSRGKRPQIDN